MPSLRQLGPEGSPEGSLFGRFWTSWGVSFPVTWRNEKSGPQMCKIGHFLVPDWTPSGSGSGRGPQGTRIQGHSTSGLNWPDRPGRTQKGSKMGPIWGSKNVSFFDQKVTFLDTPKISK
jgi:hypothetical protein